MFNGATSFNQPVGNWDISSYTRFVSNERPNRMNDSNVHSLCSVSNLDSESSQSMTD
jgi:hypothetical protein